jgi:hypothetical protein
MNRLVQFGFFFDAYPEVDMLINVSTEHGPIGAGRGK